MKLATWLDVKPIRYVGEIPLSGVEKPAMNYAKRMRAKKKALPHDPTLVPTPPL